MVTITPRKNFNLPLPPVPAALVDGVIEGIRLRVYLVPDVLSSIIIGDSISATIASMLAAGFSPSSS